RAGPVKREHLIIRAKILNRGGEAGNVGRWCTVARGASAVDDDPGLLRGIGDDRLWIRIAVAENIDDVSFISIADVAGDGAGQAGGEDEGVGSGGAGSVAVAGEGIESRVGVG